MRSACRQIWQSVWSNGWGNQGRQSNLAHQRPLIPPAMRVRQARSPHAHNQPGCFWFSDLAIENCPDVSLVAFGDATMRRRVPTMRSLIISAGGVAVGLIAFNGGVQYAFTGSSSVLPDGSVATSREAGLPYPGAMAFGTWKASRTRALVRSRPEPNQISPLRLVASAFHPEGICRSSIQSISVTERIPYE